MGACGQAAVLAVVSPLLGPHCCRSPSPSPPPSPTAYQAHETARHGRAGEGKGAHAAAPLGISCIAPPSPPHHLLPPSPPSPALHTGPSCGYPGDTVFGASVHEPAGAQCGDAGGNCTCGGPKLSDGCAGQSANGGEKRSGRKEGQGRQGEGGRVERGGGGLVSGRQLWAGEGSAAVLHSVCAASISRCRIILLGSKWLSEGGGLTKQV